MNDPMIPPNESQIRHIRRWMRLSGLVLWIILAGLAVSAYVLPDLWKRSPAVVEHPPGGGAATNASAVPSEKQEPIGDPEGIRNFELTDQNGRTVTKADLLGQPWVASFIFTRCAGPCPRITGQIKQLHQRWEGKPVRFVTFTVDPKYDTPEVLSKYAENFDADRNRWWFLTGERSAIYSLIIKSFKLPVAENEGAPLHTNRIAYVNADGVLVNTYMYNDDADMVALRRAILKEVETLHAARDDGNASMDDSGQREETARKQPVDRL